MNNLWAFLPMRESNDLLGDPEALRARLDEDSYLLLRGIIDPARIQEVRDDVVGVLAGTGWILGGAYTPMAISCIPPLSEFDEAFQDAYQGIQRLESFHTMAHDPALLDVMRQVVGPSAFPHPLKIGRLSFPTNHEVSTPPHQDFPNNQGTPSLTASWIPLGDCPANQAGLAVLRGSHRYGVLGLSHHPGPGNRQAVIPTEMLAELHWVTTDFQAGDILLFPSTAVHASLNNGTDSMRLSVDYRYQVEGEPLTPIVLEPHFQLQTWDQVYEGWTHDELQYYWRDLDFEVVPFEQFPLVEEAPPDMPQDELWRHLLRQEARHNKRMERLADAGIVDNAP